MTPVPYTERLEHILDHIAEIEAFTADGEEEFFRSVKTRRAVLYNLLVIGEAVASLPEEVRERHPQVPWRKIIGLRNVLAHIYFSVQLETIWGVVERDMPELKHNIEHILSEQD